MTPDAKAEECVLCPECHHEKGVWECHCSSGCVCDLTNAKLSDSAKRKAELRALLAAKDEEIERLRAPLYAVLSLKNPNGKAYTRRLNEIKAEARRALEEGT